LLVIHCLHNILQNQAKLIVTGFGAIGTAHAEVFAGDKICLLGGIDDPIILREVKRSGKLTRQ
jgi:hypothetical protein